MFKGFKEFIARGNVVDMAVGVIMGGAFGAIVNSLIDDIIMPLIGILMGGQQFSELSIEVGEASVAYGLFFQAIVNFFVISLSVFFMVRAYSKLQGIEEKAPSAPPEPSGEEKLLAEIRDLLQAQA
jgi:large conductance mechanosensitive channel